MTKVPEDIRLQDEWSDTRRGLLQWMRDVRSFIQALPRFRVLTYKSTTPASLEDITISLGFTPVAVLVGKATRVDGTVSGTASSVDWVPTTGGFIIKDFQGSTETEPHDITLFCIG